MLTGYRMRGKRFNYHRILTSTKPTEQTQPLAFNYCTFPTRLGFFLYRSLIEPWFPGDYVFFCVPSARRGDLSRLHGASPFRSPLAGTASWFPCVFSASASFSSVGAVSKRSTSRAGPTRHRRETLKSRSIEISVKGGCFPHCHRVDASRFGACGLILGSGYRQFAVHAGKGAFPPSRCRPVR